MKKLTITIDNIRTLTYLESTINKSIEELSKQLISRGLVNMDLEGYDNDSPELRKLYSVKIENSND